MRERTFLHRPDVLLRAQRLRYPRTTELIWVKPGATSLAGSACASLWPQPQPYRTALCFRTLRSVATNLAGLVELSFWAPSGLDLLAAVLRLVTPTRTYDRLDSSILPTRTIEAIPRASKRKTDLIGCDFSCCHLAVVGCGSLSRVNCVDA